MYGGGLICLRAFKSSGELCCSMGMVSHGYSELRSGCGIWNINLNAT